MAATSDPPPPADIASWPTGRLLSAAARLVEHSWQAFLDDLGLTHAGFIALHVLADGPLPQRTLAQRCQVTDQTVSRTVERLERAGFVVRAEDEADRRRTVVACTEAGATVYGDAARHGGDDDAVFGAVSDYPALRRQLEELVLSFGPHT